MIIYNKLGWLLLAAPLAAAYGITWLFDIGTHDFRGRTEAMIALPIAIVLDVVYRKSGDGHWFNPSGGALLLFTSLALGHYIDTRDRTA